MRNNPLLLLIAAAIPVSLVLGIAWIGTFTFVNGYVITELGRTNTDWTVATLWLTGGLLVWQWLCTEISAAIGRRATVTLGLLAAALAFAGLGLLHSFPAVCLLMALISFVIAANNAAWMPLVAAEGGERPGRAMGTVQIVSVLFGIIALTTGGRFIAAVNYQTAFLCFAAGCAACALAFSLLSRGFTRQAQARVVSLRNVSKADLLGLVRGPFLVVLLLGVCIEPFNYHTINQLFPNLARDLHHLTERHITDVVAIGRLPALCALLLLTHFIDRVKALRYYGAGLLVAGLVVVSVGKATDAGWVIAAYLGFYLAHGTVWGSNFVSINAAVTPRLRDAAFAIISIAMIATQFAVGVVHNRMLAAGMALPAVFAWCGAVAVLCGGALVLYSFSAHSSRPPEVVPPPAERAVAPLE